jgi:hypothetical protein
MNQSALEFLRKLPLVSSISGKFARTDTKIYDVYREVRMLSAEMYFPRLSGQLAALFGFLKPQKVVGFEKIRLGSKGDGGYVMLNDFASISGAYSLGIADEVSWDLEIAGRNIPVEQFDYSINKSPVHHPLFKFSKRKISKIGDILTGKPTGRILKIDIEGSEWDFFANATPEELASFPQIVGEFHHFSLYYDSDFQRVAFRALQNLNRTHQLIHIHGNNGAPAFYADKMPVPDLIELTFVLRSQYRFESTGETFPGPLDSPNLPGKEDYPLDPLLASSLCLPGPTPRG